ncbi:MAG: hypothetical protein PVH88_17925 [Ignavibacteria bacterium]
MKSGRTSITIENNNHLQFKASLEASLQCITSSYFMNITASWVFAKEKILNFTLIYP